MATYVPNATQTTEPVESRTVESAALEFRTLKTSVNSRVDALQVELDAEQADRSADEAALVAVDNALDLRTTALEQLALNGSTPGTVVVTKFVATASQTVFTLSVTPLTVATIDVHINGVYQNRDSFSLAANVVTLNEGVIAGAEVEIKVSIALQLGVTDASFVEYLPAGTGAVATTVQAKLRESVSVKDFGAVGDGVTDDTAAIQAALNSLEDIYMPIGIYIVSSGLDWSIGSRLTGAGNWSAVSSETYDDGAVTCIKYHGVGGANSYVCKIASPAVGADPSGATNMENVTCTNLTIDGGGLAEFGFYGIRCLSNTHLDYITVTNTLRHGFYIANSWNGTVNNWMAYKNLGCGITLGRNIFAWPVTATVDQSVFNSFFGYYSGYNFSTEKQNQFNETTNADKEYGIGVGGARALVFNNAQAAKCGGAGFYVDSDLGGGTQFIGGYAETCGESTGNLSTKNWVIWFVGATSGASWGVEFNGMHVGTPAPCARLTGTSPSRFEAGVIFNRMQYLTEIYADWSNFRVMDSNRLITYSAAAPESPSYNPSGVVFDTADSYLAVYKEGTFTPTIEGGAVAGTGWAYAVQVGQYTRIGRMVFFNGYIALTTKSGTASGGLVIALGNIPYTIKNANNYLSPLLVNADNMATAVVEVVGNGIINTSRYGLRFKPSAAVSGSTLAIGDISDTTVLKFSGSFVAS